MSLNKVMLIGNVGADPEVRYIDNSQTKVARIRLATTERYTDRNGESRENTEWHTVVFWRKNADVIEKFVKKGTMLYVEGSIRTREWTDQSGNKRYSTEINGDNLQLLSKRQDGQGAPAQSYGAPAAPQYGGQQPYNQGSSATTPAGPGGYQAPYQPRTAAPAASAPAAPAVPAAGFGAEGGDDDLPF